MKNLIWTIVGIIALVWLAQQPEVMDRIKDGLKILKHLRGREQTSIVPNESPVVLAPDPPMALPVTPPDPQIGEVVIQEPKGEEIQTDEGKVTEALPDPGSGVKKALELYERFENRQNSESGG